MIEPDVFGDSRGWFMETYTKTKIVEATTAEFVQDNQSYSSQKGIRRFFEGDKTGSVRGPSPIRCSRLLFL